VLTVCLLPSSNGYAQRSRRNLRLPLCNRTSFASDAVKRVTPIYPPSAKQRMIGGSVTVQFLVDKEGKVEWARVCSGPKELRSASIEAIRKWEFTPVRLDGVAVKVFKRMTFHYTPEP
jgi:TonB family protein